MPKRMAYEEKIKRYRRWYSLLLHLYPRPYYTRFYEEMQQTFTDVLREHVGTKKNIIGFIIWLWVETFVGILKENITFILMQKNIFRALLISTILLLIPLTASFFVEGWLWTVSDYVFAWILFSLLSLTFTFIARSTRGNAYKAAAALAIVGAFLLVWINGAVGIIGDSDINMLYALVVLTLFIGTLVARFKPEGMARTLFAAALVQALIPIVAFIINTPDLSLGVLQVFILNAFWVVLFIGSGLLFRHAGSQAPQ